jgi:cytochrome c553
MLGAALSWVAQAGADDRVLLVRDGATVRQYGMPELVGAIGLTNLRLAKDPHFGPDRVFTGFALEPLLSHCGKCHRMRGVGGEVGPALDRDGSLSSLLSMAQLRDYIRHDESRFPQSKMPQFSKLLRPMDIDQVASYLQAMQPAR